MKRFGSASLAAGVWLGLVLCLGCDSSKAAGKGGAAAASSQPKAKKPQAESQPREPGPAPIPPLLLAQPAVPAGHIVETWASAQSASDLIDQATAAYEQKSFVNAAALQQWAVLKGSDDIYNLACYSALAGQVESAFYWLQEAAARQGVNPEYAAVDKDLSALHDDKRWKTELGFLQQYREYWLQSGLSQESLLLPDEYDGEAELPLIIGLHWRGGNARQFDSSIAALVDSGFAYLGVSGPEPLGPRSFAWSENPDADLARIDAALDKVAPDLHYKAHKVMLLGFSQGGADAVEIAARHPERFAGALALSPVFDHPDRALAQAKPSAQQGFVLLANQLEDEDTVKLTQDYAESLTKAGARVSLRVLQKQSGHQFPPDFPEKVSGWVGFVLHEKPRLRAQ